MTKKEQNYQALSEELDAIVANLQRDDIDVDTAVAQYKRGLEVVGLLEDRLKTAENTVAELTAAFQKS